jgi:hypothetical protein
LKPPFAVGVGIPRYMVVFNVTRSFCTLPTGYSEFKMPEAECVALPIEAVVSNVTHAPEGHDVFNVTIDDAVGLPAPAVSVGHTDTSYVEPKLKSRKTVEVHAPPHRTWVTKPKEPLVI